MVDKTGPVSYKVQLIGSTVTLVVHHNRLKPCFGDPQQPRNNPPPQSTQETECRGIVWIAMSYRDALMNDAQSVGGCTSSSTVAQDVSSLPSSQQQACHSRPARNCHPPDRYGVYIQHSCEDTRI